MAAGEPFCLSERPLPSPSLALIYSFTVTCSTVLTPARVSGVVDEPSPRREEGYFVIKVHLEIRAHPVGAHAH